MDESELIEESCHTPHGSEPACGLHDGAEQPQRRRAADGDELSDLEHGLTMTPTGPAGTEAVENLPSWCVGLADSDGEDEDEEVDECYICSLTAAEKGEELFVPCLCGETNCAPCVVCSGRADSPGPYREHPHCGGVLVAPAVCKASLPQHVFWVRRCCLQQSPCRFTRAV